VIQQAVFGEHLNGRSWPGERLLALLEVKLNTLLSAAHGTMILNLGLVSQMGCTMKNGTDVALCKPKSERFAVMLLVSEFGPRLSL
jgi:hypothetical protein